MRKKKAAVAAGKVRRGPARDAFQNALARLGAGMPNLLEGTQYTLDRMTWDFTTLTALYRGSWIARRIVDIIPADMLKNWITFNTGLEPDLLKKIDIELRRTQLIQKVQDGMSWGRLYGGALGIMLIRGQGEPEQLREPLNLEMMMPGDFQGFMTLDRWTGISPSSDLVTDISDPEYGLPNEYIITNPIDGNMTRVHHSRCIRFVGNRLPYWEQIAEMYWSASALECVYDELKKRDNVSWNIAQLTFMAVLRVLKMQDLGTVLGATDPKSQAELYQTLTAQNWLMSNMGMQILDASDGLETHQYTFGGVAEMYQQFIMDVAGAAEIPVTKLFGRSPSGLNATGESDLQNYYDMIGEKQESILRPILNKILPPFLMSLFGAVPDDLDFDFNPVSEPTDKERAELAKSGTDNVVAASNAGLVSKRTALKELKQQSERTGVWTNITDEDIEKAPDEIEEMGEMGMPGMGFGGPGENDAPKSPQNAGNGPGKGNGQAEEKNATQEKSGRDAAYLSVLDEMVDANGAHHDDLGQFTGEGAGASQPKMRKSKQPKKPKAPKYTKEEGYKNQIGEPVSGGYKGIEAINKLRELKSGYVPDAFVRSDIGGIALPWGDDWMGLKHIIQERESQGIDPGEFLPKLPDIIENGEIKKERGRYYIRKDKYTAVVSPTFFDDDFTFVLTGWDENVPKAKK